MEVEVYSMNDHVNVSVCRFCLCKPELDGYKLIFNEFQLIERTIVRDVIEKVMRIKVEDHISKSRLLCTSCEGKLIDFNNFYNQVRTNEEIWEKCRKQALQNVSNIIEEVGPEAVCKEEADTIESPAMEEYMVEVMELEVNVLPKAMKAERIKDEEKRRKTQQDDEKDKEIREFYDMSCKECGTGNKFDTFAEYKQHAREVHNNRNAFIRCCSSKLSKRYSLIEHIAYHTQSEQLKCPICEKLYTKRDILNFHIKQMHGTDQDRPYQCDICLKRYVRLETLASHMKCHLSKEEKAKFRIHKCDECNATFSSIHNVKNHKKYKHLGLYAYFCTGCAKYYKSKLDYEIHRRNVHDDDGPERVQCHLCSKWFSHEKALKIHIRDTHNTESPHVCTVCGHQTKSRQALRSHVRMKHEARRFRCEYCEKAFQTPRRLNEHLTVHIGGTLYSCAFCEKTFNSNSNMYKHLKSMHPEEWMQEKAMKANNPKYVGVGMSSMSNKDGSLTF